MRSADRPLNGRTIVVTRAAEQGRRLTERLTAIGADVVDLPLIDVVDPDDGGAALRDAIARLDEFDWIVVTSANGAARLVHALRANAAGDTAGVAIDTEGPRPRIAAIGAATATALGPDHHADLIAERSIAEGLVGALARSTPARALVVQGDRARTALVDGLREMGWQVERVVAYRTIAARPPADVLERALRADAITFASGSTVRSFIEAVGAADRHPEVVVSIGPETTAAADRSGLEVTATADPHSIEGMVAALVAALGRARPP
jgi:uroporphyrinogen-III synthase